MENLKGKIKIFDDNFDLLFSNLLHEGRVIIKDKDKVCRFCGKDENETTFRHIAHAIPELIGNKDIILNNECDECNKFFAKNIEVHFDKVTKPYRMMAQIKGKKKIISYQTKDQKTKINIKKGVGMIVKESIDTPITSYDHENNSISIENEIESYIPVGVYKTLVKMALSVIPEEQLEYFKEAIKWINNPDHSNLLMKPLLVFETFIPGPKPNPKPMVFLFRKKNMNNKYPHFIFFLAFGNITYQIVVPSSLDMKSEEGNITIPRFPTPFEDESYPYGKPKTTNKDYSDFNTKKNEIFNYKQSFEKRTEITLKDLEELKKTGVLSIEQINQITEMMNKN